jgi:hypothetical protein
MTEDDFELEILRQAALKSLAKNRANKANTATNRTKVRKERYHK